MLWDALPIDGSANIWGDEIYFSIPIKVAQEADARAEMKVGEIAYWPPGNAFCIFFGRTPASSGDAPEAASPVNVLGQVDGDATLFRAVENGDPIHLEQVEDVLNGPV
jgi:hypothetical protein